MSFLKLPEHVIVSKIFSTFLTISDISKIDRAATSRLYRPEILSIFRKCILSHLEVKSFEQANYCFHRGIRFLNYSFLDHISDTIMLHPLFMKTSKTLRSMQVFWPLERPKHAIRDDEFIKVATAYPFQELEKFVICNGLTLTDRSIPCFQCINKKMKELQINECNFSVSGLVRLLPLFTDLTVLSLGYSICNDCVVDILVKSCQLLETLDLYGCSAITDKSILLIAENLRNLSTLSVNMCHNLTNLSLYHLFQGAPLLKNLWMNSCTLLTDEGIGYLKNKKLEYISLIGCTNISKHGIRQLVEKWSSLRIYISCSSWQDYIAWEDRIDHPFF